VHSQHQQFLQKLYGPAHFSHAFAVGYSSPCTTNAATKAPSLAVVAVYSSLTPPCFFLVTSLTNVQVHLCTLQYTLYTPSGTFIIIF
jgi:hypothetical protein